MALEPEDRTEEIVHTSKAPIPFKQSTGQALKKNKGTCRVVVTFHMEVKPEELHGLQDGVDYWREEIKADYTYDELADEAERVEITVAK